MFFCLKIVLDSIEITYLRLQNIDMDISIVICTYNPDHEVFTRVINAIVALQVPEHKQIEYILVNNNSSFNLMEIEAVRQFCTLPNALIVTELRQGHAYARIKGIDMAKAPIVVFMDDDNEPYPDYLLHIQMLFTTHNNVGVWGPGVVEVEYFGQVEPWLRYNKGEFQQKNVPIRQFACVKDWLTAYPPGTGFAVRREILQSYVEKVNNGIYSDLGRTGKATSSAEDVQIIFEGIKMGYAAGTDPNLKVKHLIVARKATFDYIKRLRFGMASSFAKAYCECFPEDAPVINAHSFHQIVGMYWQAIYVSLYKRRSIKFFAFESATVAGKIAGRYIKMQREFPWWLRLLMRWQNL
jgi:glycosyltransferase involved in cell wall biosynthesis